MNTAGTGCTLSSAIAANLAKEYTMKHAFNLTGKFAEKP